MKKFFGFNKLFASVAVLVSVMIFQSCLDDDDNDYYRYALPNALVTVKPVADNSFFMQLDDSTTLLPVNMKNSPYGEKEVRALVNFEPVDESSGEYDKAVHINWIDSILTKPIAGDLGDKNDEVYGTDPVDMINDWVTIAEDGYLTLRFRKWGGIPTGITQNVKDLLASREVENIFENSDFVYLLNQASGDRQILSKALNISPSQQNYITNSNAGEGLIFYGSTIVPFKDDFPKDTQLYRIMTTRLEETVQN